LDYNLQINSIVKLLQKSNLKYSDSCIEKIVMITKLCFQIDDSFDVNNSELIKNIELIENQFEYDDDFSRLALKRYIDAHKNEEKYITNKISFIKYLFLSSKSIGNELVTGYLFNYNNISHNIVNSKIIKFIQLQVNIILRIYNDLLDYSIERSRIDSEVLQIKSLNYVSESTLKIVKLTAEAFLNIQLIIIKSIFALINNKQWNNAIDAILLPFYWGKIVFVQTKSSGRVI
jgi:hypothetical protein